MKKIFILSILIAPIMAKADNVGPAAASGTPVVATANAPFATAGAETGDTTNVVSASYVKGAYNDAIAAVNKVNADKQGKLTIRSGRQDIFNSVVDDSDIIRWVAGQGAPSDMVRRLITAKAADMLATKIVTEDYNVNAVATWGSDTVTELHLQRNKSN